jgi:hypothetical protein
MAFLPAEIGLCIRGMGHNGISKGVEGIQNRIVGQIDFFRHFQGRKLLHEIPDQQKPLIGGQPAPVDPPARKIMKGVFAPGTPPATIFQPVVFSFIAARTIPVLVFQADFRQKFLRFGRIMNRIIIGS